MKTVQLKEVAHLSMGTAPPGTTYNTEGIGTPMIAGAGDYGETYPEAKKWTTAPTRIAEKGDLIVCVRATIGDLNWADQTYCLGRGVAGLRPRENKLDIKYLAYFIQANKNTLTALGTGSTFLAIRKADLEDLAIPIPFLEDPKRSLTEQRRIAGILDQADAIRRQRREALDELNTLIPALFHDMFGTRIGPGSTTTRPLSSYVDMNRGISYGVVQRGREHPNGIPLIRIGNILDNRLDPAGVVRVDPEIEKGYLRTRLCGGELLLSIRGSVGRVAVAPSFSAGWNVTREVAVIPLLKSEDNIFIQHTMLSVPAQRFMVGETRGVAQRGINLRDVRNMPIPIVSDDEKRKFTSTAKKIQSSIESMIDLINESDNLFHSLVQRAFRGEL